ncbi:MAG: hypothetical protein AAF432_10055 [Planctomycetota bacterium]
MNRINLLPDERIARILQKKRIRAWTCVVAGYAGVLGVLSVGMLIARPSSHDDIERRLANADRQIADSDRMVVSLQHDLTEVDRVLSTMQRIGPKPDWSVALAEFSAVAGDDIVIRDLVMRQRGQGRGDSSLRVVEPSDAVTLRVVGFGRNQKAVTDFVLALNNSGLIDSTNLLKSEREPLFGSYAAAFIVECEIAARPETSS